MLFSHQSCELHNSHDHGESRSLYGHKGLVHVDAHMVGGREELFAIFLAQDFPDNFDEQLLRVPRSEIKPDCF